MPVAAPAAAVAEGPSEGCSSAAPTPTPAEVAGSARAVPRPPPPPFPSSESRGLFASYGASTTVERASEMASDDSDCYVVQPLAAGAAATHRNVDVTRARRQRDFDDNDTSAPAPTPAALPSNTSRPDTADRRRALKQRLVEQSGWKRVLREPHKMAQMSLKVMADLRNVGFPISDRGQWGAAAIFAEEAARFAPADELYYPCQDDRGDTASKSEAYGGSWAGAKRRRTQM